MKKIIKEIQNKSKEFAKENNISLKEKKSKFKIIEPEIEEQEEEELTLEQKLEIIQRMRASALERQQAQIKTQTNRKNLNLEQVTTKEIPRPNLSEEREEKAEDRKISYDGRKTSYDGARATTYGPSNSKKEGLTYESKSQEDNKAPTIGQGTREERQADKAREHELSTERKETYSSELADERKKKKSLW